MDYSIYRRKGRIICCHKGWNELNEDNIQIHSIKKHCCLRSIMTMKKSITSVDLKRARCYLSTWRICEGQSRFHCCWWTHPRISSDQWRKAACTSSELLGCTQNSVFSPPFIGYLSWRPLIISQVVAVTMVANRMTAPVNIIQRIRFLPAQPL